MYVSNTIFEQSPEYAHMLMALWSRIDKQTEPSQGKELALHAIQQILDEL